ncbi:EAL domain-containing protein [uncultured Fusobacterium sp.]|uniref:EAL domain-containing protein n=1 Tax=uncultured Fusobacterium sp. TaxID=159267 RepID=UPI0027DE9DE0|nr:EAL domain-containing protein [uncultured Fusobacterium sp.]
MNKFGKFIKPIFFTLLVAACLISINSIIQIKRYSRWINYLGIVRGASQRVFKLETNSLPNDDLIRYVDEILFDLLNGNGKYNLPRISDKEYNNNLLELNKKWNEIKNNISDVRNGNEKSQFLNLSEDFFNLANSTVFSADKYTRIYSSKLMFLIIILSIISLVTCIVIFILQLKYQVFLEKTNDKFRKLIFKDELTEGNNLKQFKIEADILIKENKNDKFAIIYLDFENFKYCNDILGYKYGDYILKEYNRLLELDNQKKETSGRVSGDIFVILRKYYNKNELLKRQLNLDKHFKEFLEKNNNSYQASIYGGICCLEDIDENNTNIKIKNLIDKANFAQKTIKGGITNYTFYDKYIKNKMLEENFIKNNINKAINTGEISTYFQPKVELKEMKIESAEALTRWNNNEKFISPSIFIPILEKNFLINTLDQYIFESVCQWLKKQLDNYKRVISISVNVSKIQFYSTDFIKIYTDIKEKYNIPDRVIIIEFTESIIFDDMKKVEKIINELHNNGFLCAMDDFGKGYSSLNTLKNMKVDIIKFDSLFFDDSEYKEREKIIIEEIVTLANRLDMKTVAEGIEKTEQVEFLKEIKCDLIQGYVFYKPMPLSDFEKINNIDWITIEN